MTDTKNPEIQTILKQIGSAKRIAVVLPAKTTIDIACAGVALTQSLQAQAGKNAMIFGLDTTILPTLPFLKNSPVIHSALNSSSQLAIRVSNKNAQPSELRYEKTTEGLTVFITPKDGEFVETDVTVLPSAANFDLVIILGAANLEQLGSLYTENTKLFFETPHINIDVNPENEFYGTVNFVQTTATSLSEVVVDLVEAISGGLQNEFVSTALLAGIISQTSSFRDPKTTPQAMLKASRLVEAGAKQQEIIQHLYKTKPLPLLQLWGRALARLTTVPNKQVLSAVVTKSDLEKTKVNVNDLHLVLADIVEMVSGYSIVALFAELPTSGTQIVLAGLPYEDLNKIAAKFGSLENKSTSLIGKYEYISFYSKDSLDTAQQTFSSVV